MVKSTARRMLEAFYAERQPELDKAIRGIDDVVKERPPYNADEEQEVERYQRNIEKLKLHI